MSEILISNTGPLIALGLINQLDLLPTFYPQVWITETVHREISTNANKPLANLVKRCPFIQIHPDPDMPDCWLKNLLDPGEASTIALAVHHQNSPVMIDEKKGRNIAAKIYQLQVIGSLGILAKARTRGLIYALAPLLQELKTKNYRLSDHLITRILSDFQEEES